jgi:hypothetical protein
VGVVAALAAVIALLLAGCFGDEDPTTETTVSPDTGEVAPDPDTGEIALDPDTGEIALDPDTGELFDPGEVAHPDTGEISPDTRPGRNRARRDSPQSRRSRRSERSSGSATNGHRASPSPPILMSARKGPQHTPSVVPASTWASRSANTSLANAWGLW